MKTDQFLVKDRGVMNEDQSSNLGPSLSPNFPFRLFQVTLPLFSMKGALVRRDSSHGYG